MDWILKNKKVLMIICLLSAIFASAELILTQIYLTEPIVVEKWQAGLFLTPFIISSLSFVPLMYLMWFQGQSSGMFVSIQKAFFWVFAVGLCSVLFLMVYFFVI